MSWVKIDDGFPLHRKAKRAGLEGVAFFVAALAYANRHATDGEIRADELDEIWPWAPSAKLKKLADLLVEVGLFDATDDGWLVHDYAEYQQTSDELKAKRALAAERQRKKRQGLTRSVTRDSQRDVPRDSERDTPGPSRVSHATPARPGPTRPDVDLNNNHTATDVATSPGQALAVLSSPAEVFGPDGGGLATQREFVEALADAQVTTQPTANALAAFRSVCPTRRELVEAFGAIDRDRLGGVTDRGAWVLGIVKERRRNPPPKTWVDGLNDWMREQAEANATGTVIDAEVPL